MTYTAIIAAIETAADQAALDTLTKAARKGLMAKRLTGREFGIARRAIDTESAQRLQSWVNGRMDDAALTLHDKRMRAAAAARA